MRDLAAFLATVEVFADVQPSALEAMAPLFSHRELSNGQVLVHQGDAGDELYIVRRGRFDVTVETGRSGHTKKDDQDPATETNQITVAILEPGDFFGEMSLFEHEPRSATCRALEPAEVLGLREEDFDTLIATHPEAAIRVMRAMLRVISARLENTSVLLADVVQWGEEARRRAFTDELTGLYNRRFLDESITDHFATAYASGAPLVLVMMDLDHFTAINEEYGHEIGDQLIAAIAPAIRATFRETDILARYGGDEFTFVLPDTTAETAAELCFHLGAAIAETPFLRDQGGAITTVTTSQGIAVFPEHGTTIESLREQADRALYIAKENGRNQCHIGG